MNADTTTTRIKINDKMVGQGLPTYIIAEIGMNHNGDVKLATDMIQAAAATGVDAVKFQIFKTELFLSKKFFDFHERKKYELTRNDLEKLFAIARECGMDFISTPFDNDSVELLDELGVDIFKVASSDINNLPLLRKIGKKGKPVIFSTGYAEISEIYKARETLLQSGCGAMAVMHCIAAYPTVDEDINLANIPMLMQLFPDCAIGFSDHTLDYELIPPVAVALGASIVEKHFTIDRDLPGYDHRISLTPEMFTAMVQNIRRVEIVLGSSRLKTGVIYSEASRKGNARRSLYWAKSASKGERIDETYIIPKRPGKGLEPRYIDQILGLTLQQDVEEDTLIELIQIG